MMIYYAVSIQFWSVSDWHEDGRTDGRTE